MIKRRKYLPLLNDAMYGYICVAQRTLTSYYVIVIRDQKVTVSSIGPV